MRFTPEKLEYVSELFKEYGHTVYFAKNRGLRNTVFDFWEGGSGGELSTQVWEEGSGAKMSTCALFDADLALCTYLLL